MKIVANVVFIIFLIGLILSLVFWLSPLNTDEVRRTIGLADVIKTLSEAPTFDMSWVNEYLTFTVPDELVEPEPVFSNDNPYYFDFFQFLQRLAANMRYKIESNPDIVEFIDTWYFGPIRIIAIIGTFIVNILIYFGYFIGVIFA